MSGSRFLVITNICRWKLANEDVCGGYRRRPTYTWHLSNNSMTRKYHVCAQSSTTVMELLAIPKPSKMFKTYLLPWTLQMLQVFSSLLSFLVKM